MNIKALSDGAYHRVSEPAPGVLLLEFNSMWREMKRLVDTASADPGVRAIVLSSANDKVWTAGLDLNDVGSLSDPSEPDPARRAFALHQHILDFQGAISALAECRQPVIAALHGLAIGLAIDLASACDVRIAAEDTTMGIFEVNVGLAADIGTLQRFPRLVGSDSLARELALTGRPFGAAEALRVGYVSACVPGGRRGVVAIKMAGVMAAKSPVALVSTKHLMNHARDHTIEEGLRYTAAWNMSMLQSEDTLRAMQATKAKRQIAFPPLSRPRAGGAGGGGAEPQSGVRDKGKL